MKSVQNPSNVVKIDKYMRRYDDLNVTIIK